MFFIFDLMKATHTLAFTVVQFGDDDDYVNETFFKTD